MEYYHGMFALLYKTFWMFESMIYKKKCFVWQTGFFLYAAKAYYKLGFQLLY